VFIVVNQGFDTSNRQLQPMNSELVTKVGLTFRF